MGNIETDFDCHAVVCEDFGERVRRGVFEAADVDVTLCWFCGGG
jgi:hypothetical protein